jgi:hypothetical protein
MWEKLVCGTDRRHHRDILIRGTENVGKIGKVFSLVAEMTLTVVGMRLRIRAKLLELFGAGEGNRTLVVCLEVSGFLQCFQEPFRHFAAFWAIEITTEFLFVGMAIASPMRVLFKPFDGGYEPTRHD